MPLILPPFETNGSTLNRQGGGDPGPFRGRYCAEMYYQIPPTCRPYRFVAWQCGSEALGPQKVAEGVFCSKPTILGFKSTFGYVSRAPFFRLISRRQAGSRPRVAASYLLCALCPLDFPLSRFRFFAAWSGFEPKAAYTHLLTQRKCRLLTF